MASLGSLVVSLAMDTARFRGDIGKAAQQMARLTAEASKIGAAIGANVGIGLVAIGSLVKQSIEAADVQSKLAQSLGMTTEEISRLSYVADLAGVSQEELAASVSKLARKAVDAAAGGKQAGEVFNAMGLSVKDANGAVKSSSDLLGDIADKFATYKDGAEKTALAQEIFGKSGARLIPFLNQGREGLAALSKEADILGITLTDSAGKSAEQFNDNLTRLQKAKEGLGRQIAEKLVPTLENLTNNMFESARATGSFEQAATVAATGVKLLLSAGALIIGVFKTLGEYIGGVGAALVALFSGRFKEAFDIASMVGKDFVSNMKGTASVVSGIWDTEANKINSNAPRTGGKIAAPIVTAAEKAAKASKQIRDEVQRAYEAVEKQLGGLVRDIAMLGKSDSEIKLFDLSAAGANDEQIARARIFLRVLDDYKEKQESLKMVLEEQNKLQNRAASLYDSTRSPLEKLNQQLSEYQELLDKGAISWDTYGRAVFEAQDNFDNLNKKTVEAKTLAQELGLTFSSAAEDAIVEWKGFGELLKSLEKDIVRIITRKFVTEPGAEWITGMLKGVGGGSGGGGLFEGLSSFVSGIFGGSRASGGTGLPGHRYLVGENGPEEVTFGERGTVTPLGQTNVNNYFTFESPVDRRSQMQVASAAGVGVNRAMRRNT